MKLRVCLSAVLLIVVMVVPNCFAGEYVDQMVNKYERGVKNVVTCVAEIGRSMSSGIDDAQPVYDGLIGIFEGSGRAIVRAASGLYDIVVAPIPNIPTFPPRPETLFEEDTTAAAQEVK